MAAAATLLKNRPPFYIFMGMSLVLLAIALIVFVTWRINPRTTPTDAPTATGEQQ